MSVLDDLKMNRFLYRNDGNQEASSNVPFQGIQAGISSGNAYGSDSPSRENMDGIPTASVITNSLVRSSQGGQYRTLGGGFPIPNGRVEINQGFKDTDQYEFPIDSLTAFDGEGVAQTVVSYLGILFGPGFGGGLPAINYNYPTFQQYIQPIFWGVGRVNADGTTTSNFPPGWSVIKVGTGDYLVLPSSDFPNANYGVTLTPIDPASTTACVFNPTVSSFEVFTADAGGFAVDAPFSFQVFTNNE